MGLQWFGDRAKAAIQAEVGARMDAAGKAIVARAFELAPKDTGYMASTIGHTYNQSTMTLTIHVDAPYALPVEMGHITVSGSWVPPQPFIRPAVAMAPEFFGGGVAFATVTQFGGPGD